MKKIFILFLIIIIATFLSSIYGSIHNQITYSISNEYFTKFKFIQFGLSEDYWAMGRNIGTKEIPEIKLTSPRLGATIVGIISTW